MLSPILSERRGTTQKGSFATLPTVKGAAVGLSVGSKGDPESSLQLREASFFQLLSIQMGEELRNQAHAKVTLSLSRALVSSTVSSHITSCQVSG